jgi:hypothetical protein
LKVLVLPFSVVHSKVEKSSLSCSRNASLSAPENCAIGGREGLAVALKDFIIYLNTNN